MKKLFMMLLSIGMFAIVSATSPTIDGNPGYKIGDKATDFSLKGVDGKMYTLSGFENVNGYVVVFTCNTCPYSVMYEDRIM